VSNPQHHTKKIINNIKSFHSSKDITKRIKQLPTKLEKIFADYILFDKELTSTTYKELL
jgi:hypothetical protein